MVISHPLLLREGRDPAAAAQRAEGPAERQLRGAKEGRRALPLRAGGGRRDGENP